MRFPLWLLAATLALVADAHAAAPVVSNIRASQRAGTHLVDILYNVSDADGNSPLTIYVAVSDNGGASYNVPVFTLSGAVGVGVTPGNDRLMVWNAGVDWPGRFSSTCRVKIIADDGTLPAVSGRMIFIPAGPFSMGDSRDNSSGGEVPIHSVSVSAFLMDQFEVTGELWGSVTSFAITRGYAFDSSGSSKAQNHPVQQISWFDAVKWCNARSEKEGLVPCYYTDASHATVYRTSQSDLTNACVKWTANGYRLPTEAEWEKAARGGLSLMRFPWADTISHTNANYYSDVGYLFDVSATRGLHPAYQANGSPNTSPVGSFGANGFGLHDMSGNVREWVWDRLDFEWYLRPGATIDNTQGPEVGVNRVFRGGSFGDSAAGVRVAQRAADGPTTRRDSIGFRCVKGL